MKKDIENRADLELLVQTFYEHAKMDSTIGFYFTEVVTVIWEKHIPIMVDFWENVLFFTGAYAGNPMETHRKIHELHPFRLQDFDQWILLFHQTVDQLFKGTQAQTIKIKAANIATILKLKIIA
jgi:hemoglobin